MFFILSSLFFWEFFLVIRESQPRKIQEWNITLSICRYVINVFWLWARGMRLGQTAAFDEDARAIEFTDLIRLTI